MVSMFSCVHFCLRPSAKDQEIIQAVVVVVVAVVLSHLSHFIFKRNLSEKLFFLAENLTRVLLCASQAFYQLSYSNIDSPAMENYLFNLKKFRYPTFSNFKNQAADRGSVLGLFNGSFF